MPTPSDVVVEICRADTAAELATLVRAATAYWAGQGFHNVRPSFSSDSTGEAGAFVRTGADQAPANHIYSSLSEKFTAVVVITG